jgi:hypothetical protein
MLVAVVAACEDKAKAGLDLCQRLENQGDLESAETNCIEAAQRDPTSTSGKAAAAKAASIKAAIDAKKAAEKKKADDEADARGIDVDCVGLLNVFLQSETDGNKKYLKRRVNTSGTVNDTKWVASKGFSLCTTSNASDTFASGIQCNLDQSTPQATKAALQVGQKVKISGRVAKWWSQEGAGIGLSELTIDPCVVVP